MGCKTPIKMRSVTNRKNNTFDSSESRVNINMVNYARDVMNNAVVSELASNVSKSSNDCNTYWEYVLELTEKLDNKESKSHTQLHHILEYEIIPKLNKANLKAVKKRILESNDKYLDCDFIIDIIDDNIVMDRIITNHKALSKRFDFDKISKNAVRSKQVNDGIEEMCDLIDTYDTTLQAKFNIALENITYAMSTAGYTESVVEEITDYFLCRTPVIPDSIYETMQNLVKNSRIISDIDKNNMKYFTEAKHTTYSDSITLIASRCSDKESSELIMSTLNIKTEKEASSYIKKAMKLAETSKDKDYLIDSIFAIPLLGKVSKSFVLYQYRISKDKMNVHKKLDKDTVKKIDEILDDEDSLMIESSILINDEDEVVIEAPYAGNFENTALLESETFGESEDIRDILHDFKSEQKKSIGRFKYYMGKIYRKSPESIIDETPNILSTIRLAFIIAPTLAVPIIGPVISLVMIFIDRILSMKINEKQCNELIKKLEAERKKVNSDIEKKPERKEELEKYGKCIDACVKKVDGYRSAKITTEPIEGRDDTSDDDFDFNLDFELESAIVTLEALNTIMEATQNDLCDRLCNTISDNADLNTKDIMDLITAVSKCNRSINFEQVANAVRSIKSNNRPLSESSSIEFVLCDAEMQVPNNNIESIVAEAYYIEQLEGVLNEGFNMNKLKLLMQAAKGKAKDFSTKEKAFWRNLDIMASGFMRSVEKAMTSDRREGVIKGSLIPSFSKCIKSAIAIGGISFINPVLGIIATMGMIGVSKALNHKERQLIYDEINTELKVVEKEIEMANNDGDMKKYRCLLQYQKRLERERQRIKYGIKVHGRNTPIYDIKRKEDY